MEVDPKAQTPVPFDRAPACSARDAAEANQAQAKRGLRHRCWKLIRWPLRIIVMLIAVYVLVAFVGAWIPDNADFMPDPNGIEVYIYSGDIHSDIILPLVNEQKDWRENFPLRSFLTERSDFTHVSIGWGSRDFYLNTPTWRDVNLATTASTFFIPAESVMHVEMVHLRPVISSSMMKTKVTAEQYLRMVEFVQESFVECGHAGDSNRKPTPINDACYNDCDNFYPAVGRYHLFQTCNCWVGDALRAGGIKVGKFTPLPKSIFWHLQP